MPPIAGTLVRYKILRSYAAPARSLPAPDGPTGGRMPVCALGNLVKKRLRILRILTTLSSSKGRIFLTLLFESLFFIFIRFLEIASFRTWPHVASMPNPRS